MGKQSYEMEKILNENIEITIYNQDLALVKEINELDLKIGINTIKYTKAGAQIDPASVRVKDLEGKDQGNERIEVLEQTYEYDLESNSKLLDRYLGKEITITDKEGITYTGKLIRYEPGIILQKKDKCIISFTEVSKIEFPNLEELFIKPTLVWQIQSSDSGKKDVLISYLTTGINWRAEYTLNVNANYTKADLGCWIIIDNKTGVNFEGAKIKLIAGEIHRVYPVQPKSMHLRGAAEKFASVSSDISAYDFTEENIFEYHLYSLERPIDLKNNQIKQISFFSVNSISIEKELVYDIWKSEKVQTIFKIENSEDKGPGLPLPKGLVRIYKADSEEQLQLIGEDQIEHIPKAGEIKVVGGSAFDIKAKRTQTNYEKVSDTVERTSYEIELNNSTSEAQILTIIEHLSGDWKIIKNSEPYIKTDAFTIEFKVSIPIKEKKTVTYTVENKLEKPGR